VRPVNDDPSGGAHNFTAAARAVEVRATGHKLGHDTSVALMLSSNCFCRS